MPLPSLEVLWFWQGMSETGAAELCRTGWRILMPTAPSCATGERAPTVPLKIVWADPLLVQSVLELVSQHLCSSCSVCELVSILFPSDVWSVIYFSRSWLLQTLQTEHNYICLNSRLQVKDLFHGIIYMVFTQNSRILLFSNVAPPCFVLI